MKIIDVIKYEGDNKTFVWKYPGEDFNTMSQLIVHESQVAVLFKGGRAQDEFLPGEYRLHTKNIPLLNKIVNLPSDGVSPFHCVVYYVNKTEQMNIKWGFGDVVYEDPNQNYYPFTIGARGSLSLRINDAKAVLNKLVGTEEILTQDKIIEYFESAITMHIKDLLPKFFKEKKVSIFEMESYLPEISEKLRIRIKEEMVDYGVELVKLWADAIKKPVDDQLYQQAARIRAEQATIMQQGQLNMQRADFERREAEIRGLADINLGKYRQSTDIEMEKYRQQQLGYTYQQGRNYDIMQSVAENEGTGSDIRNAFMGMGVGFGTAGVMGKAFENIAGNTLGEGIFGTSENNNDGTASMGDGMIPGMVNLDMDSESDNSVRNEGSINSQMYESNNNINNNADKNSEDFETRVNKLKLLYEKGMISREEYDKKISAILESI